MAQEKRENYKCYISYLSTPVGNVRYVLEAEVAEYTIPSNHSHDECKYKITSKEKWMWSTENIWAQEPQIDEDYTANVINQVDGNITTFISKLTYQIESNDGTVESFTIEPDSAKEDSYREVSFSPAEGTE